MTIRILAFLAAMFLLASCQSSTTQQALTLDLEPTEGK